MKKTEKCNRIRKAWRKKAAVLLACAMALAGCGQKTENETVKTTETQAEEILSEETQAGSSGKSEDSAVSGIQQDFAVIDGTLSVGDTEIVFDKEDENTDWDEDQAVKIHFDKNEISVDGKGAVSEGNVVTIRQAGTYVLEGSLTDGTVRVDCDSKETVRLILNGVTIHSETSAAIDIASAHKTVITLAEGTTNTLSDSAGFTYRDAEKEEPNAALFSKDDLTINGTGTLIVEAAFHNAIQSKDILKIMGGTYEITSANHGIKGNDALAVMGGEMQISSAGDGLKSDTALVMLDGKAIVVQSEEGMEAETIVIGGGTIDITASDDGINASTDNAVTPTIHIVGGSVTVRADGDGLDANGSIYMSGGEVTVYGPERNGNGAIDYDRDFLLTGGRLIAFGPGGMDQAMGEDSSQPGVMMVFDETQPVNTQVDLKSEEGDVLYSGVGEREFRTVLISVPELEIGKTYQLEANGQNVTFALEQVVAYLNKDGVTQGGAMGPGGRGSRGGQRGEGPKGAGGIEGERPPEGQEFPQGERPPREREFSEGEGFRGEHEGHEGEGPHGEHGFHEGEGVPLETTTP